MREIFEAVQKYETVFACWTDRADFIVDKSEALNEDRLLEIRCFDESGEFYARRDGVDGGFTSREITAENEGTYADGSYDEAQYLDIDTTFFGGAEGEVRAAGGGTYRLPPRAKGKPLMLTRTYYRFDEDGVARKFDWRLVKFTDRETVGKE